MGARTIAWALAVACGFGCSRAVSKHSEEKLAPAMATDAAPLPSASKPTGLSEETIRLELRKMTTFFKWASDAHRGIAKQGYASPPDCENGKCSATFEGAENQNYFVTWAQKDHQAQMFESSFAPLKVTFEDIDAKLVRKWHSATARKISCKGNSGGNVLVEMYAGAMPSTKLVVYTDAYVAIDPDLATVVRSEGSGR